MLIKSLSRIVVPAVFAFACQCAVAAGAAEIASEANASLQQLYAAVPAAKGLGASAKAILVFPKVTKAGLGVGGQYGEGALLQGGKAVAYYSTAGASVGLQAGAQTFGYALLQKREHYLEPDVTEREAQRRAQLAQQLQRRLARLRYTTQIEPTTAAAA